MGHLICDVFIYSYSSSNFRLLQGKHRKRQDQLDMRYCTATKWAAHIKEQDQLT